MTFRSTLCFAALMAAGCGAPTQVDLIDDATAAEDGKADAVSSLTADQAQAVLKVIDDKCGDTWCNGDFDFRFKKIVCQPARNSCTLLTFDIYPAFSDEKPSYYWRSCRMTGFSQYADLIDTSPNGYRTLTPGFDDAIYNCTQKIEASILR